MRFLLCVFATSLLLPAQDESREDRHARFRVSVAGVGGELEHVTDGSDLDDETDAGMFRIAFEATSRKGIGGGLRFESTVSDDDLFVDAGFAATEARRANFFLHFTYRAVAPRFAMPLRIGLMLDGYQLEENVSNNDISYGSLGPYLEVAPEFSLVDGRNFEWTLYGEFGVGIAATGIDVETDSEDYSSATAFFGAEIGTRLHFGPVEFGLGIVGRWSAMDESDEENNLVVLGHDTEFVGVLLSLGVVF